MRKLLQMKTSTSNDFINKSIYILSILINPLIRNYYLNKLFDLHIYYYSIRIKIKK